MAVPILYSGTKNASSWAMRAWLALKEAKVDFVEEVVDIRRPQRFSNLLSIGRIAPPAAVPVLVVDGIAIFDSLAIMEFANDASDGALLPSDHLNRARARSVLAWQHSGLSNICARISFESAFYPLKHPLTASEQAETSRLFDHLEPLLDASGGPFLFGAVSLADLALVPAVVRLVRHRVDLRDHPLTEMWTRSILALPSVVEWLETADVLPHIWYDDYLIPNTPFDAGQRSMDFELVTFP